MKYLATLLIGCLFTLAALAQSATTESEGWLTDLDQAYELSQETGKPIMANFTGSDWCGWCKRLKKNVFVKDDFKSWADDNVILLELDFPRRKKLPPALAKQNAGLQQAFKVRGYPSVWVFNLSKNAETDRYEIAALGKTGYKATVAEFTSDVDRMISRGK